MNKVLCICGLAVVSANLCAQSQSEAQVNKDDSAIHIREVIIEARQMRRSQVSRLDVPAKDLPISMNSLSGQSLELRGIQNLQDATRFLPAVRMQTSYGAFQQLQVRGFDHAVILVDGIRDERSAIQNSYPVSDLSAVESIELLKGPAAVLYGHSTVGGVLNIVRRRPTATRTLHAKMSYGSFDSKSATMGLGGRLLGPFDYYGSINYSTQEGWRDNGNTRFSGYLALGADLTSRDRLDIRGGFNRDFYGTEIGLPPLMSRDVYDASSDALYLPSGAMLPGLDKEARYNNESDFMHHRGWNISASYTHTFIPAAKLTARLAYTDDDINYFGTESLSYLESNEPIYSHYYWTTDRKTGEKAKRYICLDSLSVSSPLRFSHLAKTVNGAVELGGRFSTGFIRHTYLGGYTFVALNRTSYSGYNLGTDVWGPGLYSHVSVHDPHSMGYMDSKFSRATVTHHYSNSLSLQDLMELGPRWRVLVAVRGDFFRYLTATASTPTGRHEWEERGDFSRIRNHALTYRFGAVYEPLPTLSLYASWSNFFMPIRTVYSENVIYVNASGHRFVPDKGGEVFKPESGYQAEAGIKYTVGTLLEANASLFYIRKENSRTSLLTGFTDEDGTEKSVYGQIGSQSSKGFDVDLTLHPLPELTMTAGYTYNNARIRRMARVQDPTIAEALYGGTTTEDYDRANNAGHWQANVPNQTFYALGSYTVPKGLLRGLGLHLSTSYTGKVYRSAANTTWFDPYWLTDMGLSYTFQNQVRLTLNVNNICNHSYYNQALGNQLVPSMPRNFQLSLSYTL